MKYTQKNGMPVLSGSRALRVLRAKISRLVPKDFDYAILVSRDQVSVTIYPAESKTYAGYQEFQASSFAELVQKVQEIDFKTCRKQAFEEASL